MVVVLNSQRYGMAPTQIPVCLYQKRKNGQLRVTEISVFVRSQDAAAEGEGGGAAHHGADHGAAQQWGDLRGWPRAGPRMLIIKF